MHWLILFVIAVALLLMASNYPKTAFGLLGALIVGFVILFRLSEGEVSRGQALVPVDEVVLSHAEMQPGYADSYGFSGRITNRSEEATLIETSIEIKLEDCIAGSSSVGECTVIGETVNQVSLQVPPGQARDFNKSVYLGRVVPKGEIRWTHNVVATQARR